MYYGTFNPEMTAYKGLISEWQASGVEVSPLLMENISVPAAVTLSSTRVSLPGLSLDIQSQVVDVYSGFGQGYVQDAFGKVGNQVASLLS